MHDLKRSKRKKMYTKQMSEITNVAPQEATAGIDELDRGYKNKNNNCEQCGNQSVEQICNKPKCGCGNQSVEQICNKPKSACGNQDKNHHPKHDNDEYECVCQCKKTCKPDCDPCEVEYDNCVSNPCGSECCDAIRPTYSTKNACPVAIEAQRIYDAVQFQIFTDAMNLNGEPIYYDYDVVEVSGNIPTTGAVKITIDEVCINYSSLVIDPGVPTVEDFEIEELDDVSPCDAIFEYGVCPEINATCCERHKGQCVSYKERGLTIIANDLVLELRGHCGCTKIVAYAYPATQQGGVLTRVDAVQFNYNTLAARICCPSGERAFTLRQSYKTSLTVDCISKAYIYAEDCVGCDCGNDSFQLTIPSGIDLICCVEEIVSVLINDLLVVLGVSQGIDPRVVDTFANVCSFPSCGDN